MTEIEDVFFQLSIGPGYCGYRCAVMAVLLLLENEDRLKDVSHNLYPAVGEQCGCSAATIERNLRTISERAFELQPKVLEQMAGYVLKKPPAARKLLEIVYVHIVRQRK